MYTLGCRFCIPTTTCGKYVTGQHTISFHKSRALASPVPLGFCCGGFSSTAGYEPGNEAQLASSYSLPSTGPCRRLPLVFIRVARESLAASLAEPFGSDSRCHRIGSPPASPLSRCVTAPVAGPFVGLEDRNLRDTCFIR